MSVETCEFFMEKPRRVATGRMSCLGGFKATLRETYAELPAILAKKNPLEAMAANRVTSAIVAVLKTAGQSKVLPPIVGRISIHMINFKGWFFARHHYPNHAVKKISCAIDADSDIAGFVDVSGYRSWPRAFGRLLSPPKFAFGWVIIKHLKESLLIWKWSRSSSLAFPFRKLFLCHDFGHHVPFSALSLRFGAAIGHHINPNHKYHPSGYFLKIEREECA